MSSFARQLPSVTLTAVLAAVCGPASAQGIGGSLPVVDENATMRDLLGAQAELDLGFVDSTGSDVELEALLESERPVILNLGYFGCPGMCGQVLNNLLSSLPDTGLVPGRDVDIWTISFDPEENAELARNKKRVYLEAYLEAAPHAANFPVGAHWRFLTAPAGRAAHEAALENDYRSVSDQLAASVGFRYVWVEGENRYDHPPVLVVLSPAGKVTRYLNALTLTPTTLRRAVVEAGEGKVGSFLERIFVGCLTFDPETGAYTMAAMTVMRIGGAITLLALVTMIVVLLRREKHRHARDDGKNAGAQPEPSTT